MTLFFLVVMVNLEMNNFNVSLPFVQSKKVLNQKPGGLNGGVHVNVGGH